MKKSSIIIMTLLGIMFFEGGYISKSYIEARSKPKIIAQVKTTQISTNIQPLNRYKIFELVNEVRSEKNLKELLFDPSLCSYAKKRLIEVQTDWSHSGFSSNAPEYKHANNWVGENLAKGQKNEKDLLFDWKNSPSHLENIIRPQFTRTCIETYTFDKSTFAVQEFASF